ALPFITRASFHHARFAHHARFLRHARFLSSRARLRRTRGRVLIGAASTPTRAGHGRPPWSEPTTNRTCKPGQRRRYTVARALLDARLRRAPASSPTPLRRPPS